MGEPAVARCWCCGTSYTSRAWPWLEALGGERRACAVPGCGQPVERAHVTALRLAAEGREAANDPPTVIEDPKRSESPMKPKKTPARKPAPEPEAPAIISLRGHTAEDHATFERARRRRSKMIGGGFVSLSQAVLALARTQAEREDAEERAQAEAARRGSRDELVRRLAAARAAAEESTRDGWKGTIADRAALIAAEDEAFAALVADVEARP